MCRKLKGMEPLKKKERKAPCIGLCYLKKLRAAQARG